VFTLQRGHQLGVAHTAQGESDLGVVWEHHYGGGNGTGPGSASGFVDSPDELNTFLPQFLLKM
jgi:hypothetical protein